MRPDDAKRQLGRLLSHTGKDMREIMVIYGYGHGQVLKDTVHLELKYVWIRSKLISSNEGQARLLLRER